MNISFAALLTRSLVYTYCDRTIYNDCEFTVVIRGLGGHLGVHVQYQLTINYLIPGMVGLACCMLPVATLVACIVYM